MLPCWSNGSWSAENDDGTGAAARSLVLQREFVTETVVVIDPMCSQRCWSGQRGSPRSGRSRSASEPPRTRPDSTTPGACVFGLVPAHHFVDDCGCLPDDPAPRRSKGGSPVGARDLIPLTVNEIRRLFGPCRPSGRTRPRACLAPIELAPRQPGRSARQPLQTSTSQTVVAVLRACARRAPMPVPFQRAVTRAASRTLLRCPSRRGP